MEVTSRLLVVLCFATIYITTIETRSILPDSTDLLLNNSPQDEEGKLIDNNVNSYRHRLEHSTDIQTLRWALRKLNADELCEFCDIMVPVIRILIATNQTEHFDSVLMFVCNEYKKIDVDVCVGAVHLYKNSVLEIIAMSPLNNKGLCALAFKCESQFDFPLLKWNVTLPNKPKPTPRPPQPPTAGSPTLTVLHLSDIHVDFAYKPGSIADCPDPLCCRAGQPIANQTGAGFWGDFRNCDIPFWTVEALLKRIVEVEKIDFIYYTGDLPPHNVWNQSRDEQLYSINTINQLLVTLFPNKTFYSAVGNHEAAPCNMFPTPSVRTDNITWLYQSLADNWIKLGLPADTRDSIVRGAFYTVIVRPGLRLISLNMNYCAEDNFWLFINSTDPLNQLQWMVDWLQYAEDHGEKVHIIGHHPPSSCLAAFSWNYYKVVNRYENTIAGQFFGHVHSDEFTVFYDEIDQKRAVSVAYIGPSVTTFSNLNPGYRIFTIDGDYSNSSYWALDHRTVIMNLTETNIQNTTIFHEEYNARNAYEMKNLFPNDWSEFLERLQNNIDGPLMKLVVQNHRKSVAYECNHNCRRALLCKLKSARSEDPHACDSIPPF
ncbi:unnamed protein product [Adineta steineri]|uniref:Sphingomyelin phosphodiesterase n=1 Tax=Adineta steineri TaxID=433720 RepID=A0A815TIM6_9BILA|nr:unnamed protein product [Adineta steineri]CAF1501471.1 unnamed protein product [Adineta steineri]